MKGFIALLLLMSSGCVLSQIPYFNIQIDTYNEEESFWEIGTYGAIESDSFYYITGAIGTPYAEHCDSSVNVRINKFNLEVKLTKLGEGEGAIIDGYIGKEWGDTVPIYGNIFNCHRDIENVNFYLSKIINDTLASSQTKIVGHAGWGEYLQRGIRDDFGNYILAGWHFPADYSHHQSILVYKADSSFNTVFYRSYPSASPISNHFGSGIIATDDGGYIVVGIHRLPDSEDAALIFKIDSLGNRLWWQEFEPDHEANETNLFFKSIIEGENGEYIVVGSKRLNPFGFHYDDTYWVAGLSPTGDMLWENEFGLTNKLTTTKISRSGDGNYLICGGERDDLDTANYEKQYAMVGKITPQGDLLWLRKYHEEQTYAYIDVFQSVIATSDGGILCVGNTKPNDIERQNIWVMKLDSLGCAEPGCALGDAIAGQPLQVTDPIVIYPNPNTGLFQIGMKAQTPSISRVLVNDVSGREVFSENYQRAVEVSVDLSREPSGLYYCRVEADGVWYVRGVVVR